MTIAERLAPYGKGLAACPECGDIRSHVYVRWGSELVCLRCYAELEAAAGDTTTSSSEDRC